MERWKGIWELSRKRVMSTVGADMLKFILAYPKSHIAIVESLPEIVPLLESEHLLTFWLFMQKLMEKNVGQPLISMGTFYDSLSYVQLQCYLLGSTTSPTSSTRISIASSHQTKKIEVDHLHDFQESLLDYIASRFKVSTENGDSFFGDKNFVILSGKIYPECIEMVDSVVNSAPDSLPPLISLVSRMENESDVLNLVNSRAFAKKEAIVKTLITYWAVYPHLKALHKPHTGCLMRTVFIKVLMEEMYKEISDKDLLKKIESLGSEIS